MVICGDDNKRAALLIRRSIEERDERESLSYQKEMCLKKAESEGLDVIETTVEEKSAYNLSIEKRPALQKILNMMMDNKIDYLICWQKSRLIRDVGDEAIITALLIETGCQVLFADSSELPMDTQEDNDVNRLLHMIKTWSDQAEVAKLRARIKQHLRTRASLGKYVGGTYTGYEWNKHSKQMVQIPGEIDIVKRIFHLYLYKGYSAKQIAQLLNEEGMKTKKQKKFYPYTIVSILQSKIYCGYYRWGYTTSKRRAAPEKVEGYEHHVDWIKPIITLEEWNRVQNIMISRSGKKRGESNNQIPKSSFLLSGKIYCGFCGNKMHGRNGTTIYTRKDGRKTVSEYFRYVCNSLNPHPVPKRVDSQKLDYQIFVSLVQEVKKLDRNALLETVQSELDNVFSELVNEKKGYQVQIEKHQKAIENLLINVEKTTDLDLLTIYGDRIKAKKNEVGDYRKKVRFIEGRLKKVEINQKDLEEFLVYLGTIEQFETFNQERKKLYMDNLVDQVLLNGDNVEVKLKWDLIDQTLNEVVTSINMDVNLKIDNPAI